MANQKVIIYQLFPRLFGNKNTQPNVNGSREENGCGKFQDVNDRALLEIKKMGITHIWYTGVIEHAVVEGYPNEGIEHGNPLVIKGKAGSPYAIKDYYDVNPDLAVHVSQRMDEFEELVARTHQSGLKLLIDFVPNHLAREYKSDMKPSSVEDFGEKDDVHTNFANNNNFYYLPGESLQLSDEIKQLFPENDYREEVARATGNDRFTAYPGMNDWYETVKLNYGIDYTHGIKKFFDPIPDTWLKMKDVLHYWAVKGVDGFRCDMVEMVPVEFWHWVIPQLKQAFPWLIFVAEVYNPQLYNTYIFKGKFDYLYDKVGLYDTLIDVIKGTKPAKSISETWQNLSGIDKYMLRFMENHDEQRIASPFVVNDARKAIPAMAVSAFIHQGPLMIYNGQEVGERGEGPCGYNGDDGRTSIFDYWNMPEHQKWMNNGAFDGALMSHEQSVLRQAYVDINQLCAEPAIREGLFYDVMWQNKDNHHFNSEKIYAFIRYSQSQKLMIVCNFSEQAQSAQVIVPKHAFETLNIPRPVKITFSSLVSSNVISIGSEELINEGVDMTINGYGYAVLVMKW
ncbi:alpha-amylase family glycosyl hydrolase [Carboxylicivirga marina]|uniref:Alpha-amylase n=1 Tax=Carboxylicivirga marina TaxID=2800988 RepID=A0ABS1HDQ6_9BACT|nr:alpha-amylase family glycosyl hydrolase [Carboxylicivirga marina]MBK3515746.1 alpha-amylase [Carboxylicivirga marina]